MLRGTHYFIEFLLNQMIQGREAIHTNYQKKNIVEREREREREREPKDIPVTCYQYNIDNELYNCP